MSKHWADVQACFSPQHRWSHCVKDVSESINGKIDFNDKSNDAHNTTGGVNVLSAHYKIKKKEKKLFLSSTQNK